MLFGVSLGVEGILVAIVCQNSSSLLTHCSGELPAIMKKDEKRQEKTESRYEKLVDKFIDTAREMSVKQEKTINL